MITITGHGATEQDSSVHLELKGLGLRDLFAMAALAGYMASPETPPLERMGEDCYYIADAMLKARGEEEP